MQGPHQDPQKLTTTGFPRSCTSSWRNVAASNDGRAVGVDGRSRPVAPSFEGVEVEAGTAAVTPISSAAGTATPIQRRGPPVGSGLDGGAGGSLRDATRSMW